MASRPWGAKDDPRKPNYYCGKQHRLVRILGDLPNREAAEVACEYDYSKDCKIPGHPWWNKMPLMTIVSTKTVAIAYVVIFIAFACQGSKSESVSRDTIVGSSKSQTFSTLLRSQGTYRVTRDTVTFLSTTRLSSKAKFRLKGSSLILPPPARSRPRIQKNK